MPETWTPAQIEASLSQLRNVVSVRVVADEANKIKEIHALMSGDRNPKQVVRDIESAILTRHGLKVDHKTISVAQMDPGVAAIERLRWLDVALSQEGRKAKAAVTVQRSGRAYVGSADGQRSSYNVLRLVAEATIRAIEGACSIEDRFAVQDLATIELGGQTVVVALISLVGDQADQLLTGSAVVQQSDTSRAVAHATLDALNRRVQWLPAEALEDSVGGETTATR